MSDAERHWYASRGCTHSHCPLSCDKPQPSLAPDGRLLCSRCLVEGGVESEMVPCVPETCVDLLSHS